MGGGLKNTIGDLCCNIIVYVKAESFYALNEEIAAERAANSPNGGAQVPKGFFFGGGAKFRVFYDILLSIVIPCKSLRCA